MPNRTKSSERLPIASPSAGDPSTPMGICKHAFPCRGYPTRSLTPLPKRRSCCTFSCITVTSQEDFLVRHGRLRVRNIVHNVFADHVYIIHKLIGSHPHVIYSFTSRVGNYGCGIQNFIRSHMHILVKPPTSDISTNRTSKTD